MNKPDIDANLSAACARVPGLVTWSEKSGKIGLRLSIPVPGHPAMLNTAFLKGAANMDAKAFDAALAKALKTIGATK